MIPRLLERYNNELVPALREKLGRKNRLSLPRLEKIVVNMGVGSAVNEKKYLEEAVGALSLITGQKPVVTQALKPPIMSTASCTPPVREPSAAMSGCRSEFI